MQQDSYVPVTGPETTLTRLRTTGRIVLPLAAAAAVTWLGVVVFLEVVTTLLT